MKRPNLDAIRKRRAGITPPPWKYDDYGLVKSILRLDIVCQTWGKTEDDFLNAKENGQFIAHAPTDIDVLLEYIEELEERCD